MIGFEDYMLRVMKRELINEAARSHGRDVLEAIWSEVMEDLTNLFEGDEIEWNVDAWESGKVWYICKRRFQ